MGMKRTRARQKAREILGKSASLLIHTRKARPAAYGTSMYVCVNESLKS